MTTFSLALRNGEAVSIFYATTQEGWAGKYFNGKRLGFNGELTKCNYANTITVLEKALVAEIESAGFTFDAVVCPPSSGSDVDPYRQAVLKHWPVRDLSANFTRRGQYRAASDSTTLENMISEFVYTADGTEGDIKSLLIIDESIASGKTIEAVIYHLRQAGMSSQACVAAAVCVRMG